MEITYTLTTHKRIKVKGSQNYFVPIQVKIKLCSKNVSLMGFLQEDKMLGCVDQAKG